MLAFLPPSTPFGLNLSAGSAMAALVHPATGKAVLLPAQRYLYRRLLRTHGQGGAR